MPVLTIEDVIFHSFGLIAVIGAVLVVLVRNPIYSALFLAVTMSVLGVLFFQLDAPFVAVAQVTVYAGAVMVLFVMVLMLFDLKHEREQIFKLTPMNLVKFVTAGLLCGFFVSSGWLAVTAVSSNSAMQLTPGVTSQELAATYDKPINKDTVTKKLPKKDTPPTEVTETLTANARQIPEDGSVQLPADEDISAAQAAGLVEKDLTKSEPIKAVVPVFSSGSSTAQLSMRLFTKYVFAFEAISLLLLVAIVGAVALARSKGGTHHVAK